MNNMEELTIDDAPAIVFALSYLLGVVILIVYAIGLLRKK